MSSFRIRPRFSDTMDLSPGATGDRLCAAFAHQSPRFEVKAFPGYICLRIPPQDRNFWSPRLTLSLNSTPEGTTRIEGIYGPNANVWSLFLFGYLIVGLLGTFAGMIGIVQVKINSSPWGLWVLGGLALVAALLYLSAQLGQKLGAWQTFQLHQAYETAVGRPLEIH